MPRLFCIQWKFTTPDHRNFANSDSYFFFEQALQDFEDKQERAYSGIQV